MARGSGMTEAREWVHYGTGAQPIPRADGSRDWALTFPYWTGEDPLTSPWEGKAPTSAHAVLLDGDIGRRYSSGTGAEAWPFVSYFQFERDGDFVAVKPDTDRNLFDERGVARFDEGTIGVDPVANTVRLTGRLAFLKQYESWSAAGSLSAMVGAFVDGAANLIASLRVPR